MRKISALLFLFIGLHCCAQDNFLLKIIPEDKDTSFLSKEFSYRRSFSDTLSRNQELKSLIDKFHKNGYLEAHEDSFKIDSSLLIANVFIGKKWEWARLSNRNVDEVILGRIGFREKLYRSTPFNMAEVNALLGEILTYCENNGYPFASVKLDSFHLEQELISAKIFLTRNKLITIDSIVVKGDAKIANRYLANYLGLRTPAIYHQDVINKISTRLKELPFVTEERPAQLLFYNDRAIVTLYLKKKNASRFDFVLGVLPNSNSNGKLLITGDGQLTLANSFGRGEYLDLRFSQLQSRTTQVTVKGSYPYLLGIPFGIDGLFDLYKNDTLYLNVKEQIGIQYLFTGTNYLKVFFHNEGTSVLSLDTNTIIQTKQLPSYLDLTTKFYGIEYKFEQLDYRLTPRKGYDLFFNGEAGTRKIKVNAKIASLKDPNEPSFDFATLYDSLDISDTQFRLAGYLDKYWSVSARSAFKLSYNGGGIITNKIFQNELYHIGGFHLLRGFDEASIFVSQYHVGTVEYHFFMSQNSFLYLFFDGSYIENRAVLPATSDTPYGFGAGVNFATKAGIFAVSYALGSQQGNPIQLRSAKIHFGYVNYF